jgi:undecaprenyl-diphosphatase
VSVLSYPEAIAVGGLQGLTELFPVSSLGHSVLLPAVVGGSWARDLDVSAPESPYLAFIVGVHVATAAALLLFFWRDWVRIAGGFLTSVRYRRAATPDERLAWLIIVATIPVGLSGLLLEHIFRTTLGRPIPAACFLFANGVLLAAGERMRRRRSVTLPEPAMASPASSPSPPEVMTTGYRAPEVAEGVAEANDPATSDDRLSRLSFSQTIGVGAAQALALLPGISRSGVTMVAGLTCGLSHEDAARFSFLLATPVILAAGVLKVPDLFGPLGTGIHGQVLAGSLASFVAAYLAVRFLTRYFHTKNLTPFAFYCMIAGLLSLVWLGVR